MNEQSQNPANPSVQPNPPIATTPLQPTPTPQAPVVKPVAKKVFVIIGIVLLLIIAIVAYLFYGGQQNPTAENTTSNAVVPSQAADQIKKPVIDSSNAQAASHLLVYGTWTGQTSLIKGVDLTNGSKVEIATLPLNIKKVSVLTPTALMYIDKVDTRDHGKQISVYDVQKKVTTAAISAEEGFGIDDYVLSPDKKYLATWEVKFAPGSQILQGGSSRVYLINLADSSNKILLYDESVNPTTAVHYPRAVLNNGTVLSDSFMANDPNGGAGWAYGASVATVDGTKKEIDTMKAGTYGTQPSLSPDGAYLVFAGYNGAKGDGNANVSGYRRALLTPNTVELLDTQTLKRIALPNLDANNSYTAATWDSLSGNIILTVLSKDPAQLGTFAYDLDSKKLTKLTTPKDQAGAYRYVSELPGGKSLIGLSKDDASNLGNLGDEYAYTLTKIAVLQGSNVTNIPVQDSYIQQITLVPGTYFSEVLGVKTIAQAIPKPTVIDLYSDENDTKQNMQLYTFFVKAELQPTRLNQQTSTPVTSLISQTPGTTSNTSVSPGVPAPGTMVCQDLAETQCQASGIEKSSSNFQECITANREDPVTKCNDSPLYLYGQAGMKARVKIQTPVFNDVPDASGEYAITLGENGAMHIAGRAYDKIAYDYQSNLRRITPPTKGTVAAKKDVEAVVRSYAHKLGLNEKETADLVMAAKTKITSPYALISFFDHEVSQQILPIAFYPQPDNYLNIVFYFKQLSTKPIVSPDAPEFPEPISRTGFTAVEISEMVE